VMTSSNSPETLARCKKLGVTCYVPKPITLSSFSGAIANTFHAMDDTGTLPRNFKS
jgi:CheY-like chemotaxis protein